MIACRFINHQSDFIYSNEFDFATYIGPEVVFIKSFKYIKGRGKNKEANIGEICLCGCSNIKMEQVKSLVVGSHIKWTEAKYPLLDCKDHLQ